MGGHYFVYIKSFEDGKWYNFNDSSVTNIAEAEVRAEIQKMYGGGADAKTSSYMLQYRRCGQPAHALARDQIPDYLLAEIEAETQALVKEQQAHLEKLLTIQVKVFGPEGDSCLVSLHKTRSVADLAALAAPQLNIAHSFRLRHFDPRLNVMLEQYDEHKSLIDNGIHGFNVFIAEPEPF